MGQEHIRSAIASGVIRRSRIVYGSGEFLCAEYGSFTHLSFPPLGVAQEYSRNAPGTPFDTSLQAAVSGDEVMIYTHGAIALVECGGTVTGGKLVGNVGDGTIQNFAGAPPFSGYALGIAQEDGTAGEVIRVQLNLR